MGVYVFRSRVADFVKVGHYAGADAWGRVARRGFHSCVCPFALGEEGKDASQLELVAWFPDLGTKDERAAHARFRCARSVGEWHAGSSEAQIVSFLCARNGGRGSTHESCSLENAAEIAVAARRRGGARARLSRAMRVGST